MGDHSSIFCIPLLLVGRLNVYFKSDWSQEAPGGFSPADIREAATQFYMGDKSRTSGRHHGMGLYIAESAAQQHGGALMLENASSGAGRGMADIKDDPCIVKGSSFLILLGILTTATILLMSGRI
jgi:signal transduction histidine kinase